MTQRAHKPDGNNPGLFSDSDDSLEKAWNHFVKTAQTHDAYLRGRVDALETMSQQSSSPSYLASLLPSLLRIAPPRELVKALRPLVEQSIAEGVQKHARVMADIIFPLILPAIKRAVLDLVRQMLQAFDRTLEEALSIQGLKWRWQAIRSGLSFAEVVLLNTLIYRVEEVFFIHKKTGLLLAHAARQNRKNPDEIAAMLTAIRDFVSDVYAQGQDVLSLKNLEVGDVQIWIEDIPQAALAVTLRGEAPQEYRDSLLAACLTLRRDFERELLLFEGDTAPFTRAEDTLQEIIIERLRDPLPTEPLATAWKQLIRWLGRSLLLLSVAGLALFGLYSIWQAQKREAELKQFVSGLEAHEGVMVVEHTSQGTGRYEVRALRDRFAETDQIEVPQFISLVWGQYESLDPEIVTRRIHHVLKPPPTLKFDFNEGTLRLEGSAPQQWIEKVKSLGPSLAGLERIDVSQLSNMDQEGFAAAERRLEALSLEAQGNLPMKESPEPWRKAFLEQSLLLDRHARSLGTSFYIVLETSVDRPLAAQARERLQQLASQLAWELQTKGITTYRIIRTELKVSELGKGLVKVKVARHGVRYEND